MTSAMQKKIKARRLEILYGQSYSNLFLSSLLAVSMAFVFRNHLSQESILAWLLVFTSLTGFRLYRSHAFLNSENTSSNPDYWFSWHLAGVIISGLIWGGFILLLVQSADNTYLSLAIMCAAGLCAGAATAYSASLISFLVFSIPLLSPIGGFLVLSEQPTTSTLGYFIFLFLIAIIAITYRSNKSMTSSLGLEIEKEDLLAALETEKQQVIDANKNLEKDIQKKIQTEAILLYEKKSAEDISDKLRALSTQDGLTGINNRRRFDEALYDEWYRAVRLSTPLSLIICDIDKFKEYNDTHGHLAGDQCLIRIAHLIDDYARRTVDIAARFGGEEFAIILPDTDGEDAKKIAEQIRMAIIALALPHGVSSVADIVTASFGVHTTTPEKDVLPDTLIDCTDKAMYQAKAQGRNRVVTYKDRSENQD
jgi:diguanylate cyclase (GGDEF)-like protein